MANRTKKFPQDFAAALLAASDLFLFADVSDNNKSKQITATNLIAFLDAYYLAKSNEIEFVPTSDYHPATKKYVDDNAGGDAVWDQITGDQSDVDVSGFTNDAGYLTTYEETDPVFSSHPAHGITIEDMTDIGNLSGTNTGDQSSGDFDIKDLSDSLSLRDSWTAKLDAGGWYDSAQNVINLSGFNDDLSYESPLTFGTGLTRTVNTINCDITQYTDSNAVTAIKSDGDWKASEWDTAYGWGNHAGLYDSTGTALGLVGTHELNYNHALIATALQSETDPVFSAWDKSTGISITESQISDLKIYLTEETDPVFSAWLSGPPNISTFTNDSTYITGVEWDEIGGNQSDISVSGFTNDCGYLTDETDTLDDVIGRGDTSATGDITLTAGTLTAAEITDGTAALTGGSLTSVKLGSLTLNGFIKAGSGDGTLSVDTNTYITTGDAALNYLKLDCSNDPLTAELEVPGILVTDKIKFTQADGNEYIDSLADGYLDIGATTAIRVKNIALFENAIYLTQTDGAEYIDSLADGYVDIGAGTQIRLLADVELNDNMLSTDNISDFGAIITRSNYTTDSFSGKGCVLSYDELIDEGILFANDYDTSTPKPVNIEGSVIQIGKYLGGDLDIVNDVISNINISKADPELRLTDTGNDEYSRLTRSDTSNEFNIKNRVSVPGGTAYSLSFDAAAERVDLGTGLDFSSGDKYTWNAWVYPTANPSAKNEHIIFGSTYNGPSKFPWYIGTTKRGMTLGGAYNQGWHFGIYDGSWHTVTSNGFPTVNNWYMVTAVYDGATMNLYVNGSSVVTPLANTNGVPAHTEHKWIGLNYYSGYQYEWEGLIDEVAVWSRALSSDEITALYNSGNGMYADTGVAPFDDSLEGAWHFDEGIGTSAADITGSNNGTVTGASWTTDHKVDASASMEEATVINSIDGTLGSEQGIHTFGSATGRTVIEGTTVRFNRNGSEEFQIDSSGDLVFPDSQYTYFGSGKNSLIGFDASGLIIQSDAVTATDYLKLRGGTNGIDFFIGTTEQITLTDGKLTPTTDNDIDLGDATHEFKDLYIDGTANIDSLIADTADINGGTVDAITSLTVANNVDIGNYTLTANGLTIDGTFTDGTLSIVGGEILNATTLEANTTLGFEISDVQQVNLTDGVFAPTTDDDIDLGDSTHGFKDLQLRNQAFIGGVTSTATSWDVSTYQIGHWKMNDNAASSTVLDYSGNDYHGTYTDSGGAINTSTGSTAGKIDRALDFDGGDEYVTMGDNDAFSMGNGSADVAFSGCAWCYMDDATGFRIITKEDNNIPSREWGFWVDGTDKLILYLWDESTDAYRAKQYSTALTSYQGAWHHFGFSYDGSGSYNGITLYVDGVLMTSTNTYSTGSYTAMENLTVPLRIGMLGASYFANGLIEDVRLFKNHIITADEIGYIYNSGSGTYDDSGSLGATHHVIATTSNYTSTHGLDSLADLAIEGELEVNENLYVDGNSQLLGSANVIIVPTSDPGVAGALWNNAGTLEVSAG